LAKNANVRAGFSPKLLTERTAPEPNLVSLGLVFSKAVDSGKTVRIFKQLICQSYSGSEIRAFRVLLGAQEGRQWVAAQMKLQIARRQSAAYFAAIKWRLLIL
jgi:hypothetical protein